MHLNAYMSQLGKNCSKEHLHGSHMIYKLQEYIFATVGLHFNSLGWLEQNVICNNQLVARGAWDYVDAFVWRFAVYFLVNQVSFKFILGLQNT